LRYTHTHTHTHTHSSDGRPNFKRFRKNTVLRAASPERVGKAQMMSVAPKESEMEVQLRLQAAAEAERGAEADKLFDDEGPARKRKR
jgi:hypothetical protein